MDETLQASCVEEWWARTDLDHLLSPQVMSVGKFPLTAVGTPERTCEGSGFLPLPEDDENIMRTQ